MSIVDWNEAPAGTTHVFVPSNLPNPLYKLRTWERWADNKVFMWDDESQQWSLMSFSDKLVDPSKRAANPNIS